MSAIGDTAQCQLSTTRAIKQFVSVTFLWLLLLPVALIILGAASNQAAVIANHDTMPVLINEARIAAHGGSRDFGGLRMLDPEHSVMTAESHLKVLCDVIDVGDIESVGDLMLDLGEWLWTFVPYTWGVLICLRLYSMAG
jgi:hypothetical protein